MDPITMLSRPHAAATCYPPLCQCKAEKVCLYESKLTPYHTPPYRLELLWELLLGLGGLPSAGGGVTITMATTSPGSLGSSHILPQSTDTNKE